MNLRHAGGRALFPLLIAVVTVSFLAGSRQEAKPDLTVSLQASAPDWPRNDVFITVTVTNPGDAPSPASGCEVYIRNARPPRQTVKTIKKDVRALDPGDHFAISFKVRVALGMYEIEAVVDKAGRIAEKNEDNNKARLTVTGR